jgi:hypothetical protein
MNRFFFIVFLALLTLSPSVQALDPKAPVSERAFGVVYVKSPLPSSDIITLNGQGDNKEVVKMQPEVDARVKVGDYMVRVEMQDYSYEQEVSVRPTERHEIIVPGFGNLVVKGAKGTVEVYAKKSKKPESTFNTNYVKTLPSGVYDVKVKVGKYVLDQNDISVVTNTTREINVKL